MILSPPPPPPPPFLKQTVISVSTPSLLNFRFSAYVGVSDTATVSHVCLNLDIFCSNVNMST